MDFGIGLHKCKSTRTEATEVFEVFASPDSWHELFSPWPGDNEQQVTFM